MYNKFHLSFFFSYFFIIVSSFNYLLLLCIGLYSPFQLCKIKILYCKWIERGYKYIFYVKSSNCTILNVSAVIYVIMFMYNLEINYLSIYLSIDQAPESAGIEITNADVYKHFKSLNPRKSKGPDGVSPKVLRICSQQLSPVYTTIFQQCVKQHIPGIWKTAIVVPVPKKRAPKELNDYRPISLTSIPFKTLERIVQDQLCRESATVLDNLQFSYQKKRSVEDATLTYTNLIYEHLEKPNSLRQNPIY